MGELLGDPNVIEPQHCIAALEAYDAVRRPRAQQVVASSKETGNLLCLRLEGIRDDEDKLKDTFSHRYEWLWNVDVEAEVERARRSMLDAMATINHKIPNGQD